MKLFKYVIFSISLLLIPPRSKYSPLHPVSNILIHVFPLVQWFQKCWAHPNGEVRLAVRRERDFLGKFYSKTELIITLRMAAIDCLISCIAFRNTL